jgi:hypothetical protein
MSRDRQQRRKRREQKERGSTLREWLRERGDAAKQREKEALAELESKPRGVDRVPGVLKYAPEVKTENITTPEDDNYQSRRRSAVYFRSRVQRVPRETIFKDRPQVGTKGPIRKAEVRSGSNQPYRSPKRDPK